MNDHKNITVIKNDRVGPEWVATATNGVDVYHAAGKTRELAAARAITGLKSVLCI